MQKLPHDYSHGIILFVFNCFRLRPTPGSSERSPISILFFSQFLDGVNQFFNRFNLQIVGERDVESRFEFHYEFHSVEGVETEFVEIIVDFEIYIFAAKFFYDFVYLLQNIHNSLRLVNLLKHRGRFSR